MQSHYLTSLGGDEGLVDVQSNDTQHYHEPQKRFVQLVISLWNSAIKENITITG